jgi:hypothetical protein
MFLFLAAILMAAGLLIALYFSATFSLGAWITAFVLCVFACLGRYIAISEPVAQSQP